MDGLLKRFKFGVTVNTLIRMILRTKLEGLVFQFLHAFSTRTLAEESVFDNHRQSNDIIRIYANKKKKLKTALDLPIKIEYCLELPLELSAHYEFQII